SRRRHTRCYRDWSSDVCSSDLMNVTGAARTTTSLLGALDVQPSHAWRTMTLGDGQLAFTSAARTFTAGACPGAAQVVTLELDDRSEERRVGKEYGLREEWESQR